MKNAIIIFTTLAIGMFIGMTISSHTMKEGLTKFYSNTHDTYFYNVFTEEVEAGRCFESNEDAWLIDIIK